MQYEVMYPLQRASDERPVAAGKVLDLSEEDAAELVESGVLREVPGQRENSQDTDNTPPDSSGETGDGEDGGQNPEPEPEAQGLNAPGGDQPGETLDDAPDDSEPATEPEPDKAQSQKSGKKGK